ncbi:threonine--tRNA ligase [Candidatus Woesebacteria bacterium RIFOXYB1_FULL_41_13]|uniref:Threonine--tRNA ligase n=1 Tax=Candidatus Woesebacteria bacterium RIFOXYB1_FULL_41_13 TaxID=1802540 RepID=A0A1F8CZW2_9BACT|nr:MAG: threonine--tRNA ligase [Candidatus Woesebacteria bacterium RIFOXYB1_FULL_41_13]
MELEHLRHSCSHLLASAVLDLWPDAKLTLGPAIEDGFYYDIDFGDTKISEADFPKIEEKMHDLVKSWSGFEKEIVSQEKALEIFKGNDYKAELIQEIAKKDEEITLYKSGNFFDLCRGGHIEKPSQELKHFKILSVAGAYWRGDEKNKMLTRIYGTIFSTQKELDEFLERKKLAEESDHRKIGKDLNLFVFSDLVGKGLPLLTPKGSTIRRELERFVVDTELDWGYQHVYTPPIAKTELYKTSGHYPYYKDTMYPVMKVDEDELILRPMTCPHHFMLYKSQPRSYRELPIKLAEISPQFRYEKSGELSGLMRVRTFILTDSHIFTQKENAKEVIKDVLKLIDYLNEALGFKKGVDYRFRLSLGDRKDEKKYYKDDTAWDFAEEVLRNVLKEVDAPYYEAEGEAAFYGPKIDVQIKKINGQEETAFTVQYDFVMPKRFELKYIDEKGKEVEPVVIHRASIGAIERTMAFLIEKYRGNFPTWLTPVQVKVLPIAERHLEYAKKISEVLAKAKIRVEVDDKNDTLGAKIRNAQSEKVAYMFIVGDKEKDSNSVSVRKRDGEDLGSKDIEEFTKALSKEILEKATG